MLFLKQPLSLPFVHHKSATITCQIDSYKFSNSKLKPGLCNYVKARIVESTAPPQQKHKRGTIFWGHPVDKIAVNETRSKAEKLQKLTKWS